MYHRDKWHRSNYRNWDRTGKCEQRNVSENGERTADSYHGEQEVLDCQSVHSFSLTSF